MPDIEVLRVIWWLIVGVVMIGFAVTDGFDFGVAALFPFVARNESERRVVLNTIGPFWEGNQVWILLGAGAIFAAWPYLYAVAFSGFYFLILLLLLTMGISRPVSFKYRSKLANPVWRETWDRVIFIGGVIPALIFGILIGNVLQGVPFYFDESLRLFYTGSFFALFNPFSLLCGLMSLAMLGMHGGIYLAMKTEHPIHPRALFAARWMAFLVIIFFLIGGIWLGQLPGYLIQSDIDPMGPSNPLHKVITPHIGAWLRNYVSYPYVILFPALGFLGALFVSVTARAEREKIAFCWSAVSIFGVISSVGISLFPFLLPSSTDYSSSLLIWDASSSHLTLLIMLFATIFLLPIILLYTSWVYWVLGGKVKATEIEKDEHHVAY
jgi:cytochrome d ubiquinol oxidase subunit II